MTQQNTASTPEVIVTSKPSFGDIPLDCIRASKTNPRKIFDDSHLQDLANSIKTQGVAQPILVRPVEVIDDITYFEIVAGERRFRASRIAGMLTVPAIVRELSDRQAYEIQVLENLQRVDLHPLEEAEGFEVMMATYGDTADELAAKIGKSRAYIYASLKLCALEPAVRKFFYSGELTKSTALLVARIPVKAFQMKCAEEITGSYNGAMSTRNAALHIERNYMLDLKKAVFKPSDADLYPQAGPCTTCPKRTGNQPEIFTDVNADVCTDSICFKAKEAAHFIRIKAVATAKGQTVLSGVEAKKIMPNWYGELKGYVKLDETNYDDQDRRTYREILGKNKPLVALLENPHSEGFIEVISVTDVAPILQELGIKSRKKTAGDEEASKAQEKELAAKGRLEQEFRQQLFEANHHASLMMNLIDPDLRLVAKQLFSRLGGGTIPQTTVMRLHGWEKGENYGSSKISDAIDAFQPAQLNQFIRDCVLCGELETYSYTPNDPPKNLMAFAARAKVDAKGIRATLTAAAKAKADAKKKSVDSKAAKAAKTLASAEPEYVAPAPAEPSVKKAARGKATPAKKPASAAKPVKKPDTKPTTPAVHENRVASLEAWPFPTSSAGSVDPKPAQPAAATTTQIETAQEIPA